MVKRIIAAVLAASALVAGVSALAGCAQETYVEYTLYSSTDEVIRTDKLSENPNEEVEGQPSEDELEEAPAGSYYMVTGYSGRPVDVVIPAEVNGVEVRGVGEQAFIQSRYLHSLVIEEGVSTIGGAAFAFNRALTTVELPSTIQTTYSTFSLCESLTSITIPEGVTKISSRDFYRCSSLSEINADGESDVNLPSTLTAIENQAFRKCASLKGAVVIPDGVTVIEYLTFAACSGITQFVFEGDITYIDYAAFTGCTALGSIEIPSTVTFIEEGAFSYCTSLTEIALPSSLEYMGSNVFEGAAVTSVVMPAGKGAWLYTESLAEDDPETEEDESVAPGSEEAEDYLFNFYLNDELEGDPDAKGRIPSYALADSGQAAEWVTGELLTAYWYFVAV
mgnify:FL=1